MAVDADPRDYPVAPNVDNTFAPLLRRLPIGRSASAPNRGAYFRLWIPTMTGGTLKVRHDAHGWVELQRPLGTPISKRAASLEHVIEFGTSGWFFVKAVGAPVKVSCTFKQIGVARDGPDDDSPPLLPYNFWFWPTAKKLADGEQLGDNEFAIRALELFQKYTKATGREGMDGVIWESAKHQRDVGAPWEGHCHFAAAASFVFEPPVAQTINHVRFDTEEIELLAAEWFGNFGELTRVFTLSIGDGTPGRFPLLAYFKPGGRKRPEDLVRAVSQESEHGFERASMAVYLLVELLGGEQNFELAMNVLFGTSASVLYRVLINWVLLQRQPLMGNMRTYSGAGGPEEVWNQAVFMYEADYKEAEPVEDETMIEVACRIYANQDTYPSTGLPADVKPGQRVPHPVPSRSLLYQYTFRLGFDRAGDLVTNDKRNAWLGAKNDSGEDIYALTDLEAWKQARSERWKEPPGEETRVGNPLVGYELFQLGFARFRKRFGG